VNTEKNNLTPETLKTLSKQNLAKSLSLVAFDWAVIAGTIALTQNFWSLPLYLLAVLVIGNRQHGLLILMHDSSHFRFSRNRKLNDFFGEFLTAWPLFIRMKAYREKHLAHHKNPNTEMDPDFREDRYPQTRKQILIKLLGDGLALNTLQQFEEIKRLKTETSTTYKTLRISFYLALAVALTVTGTWKPYLLFWIVPSFTWLKVVLRLRAISDHTGVQAKEKPFDTRTIVPTLMDRIFLAPHSCSFHVGHHIYAAVPCYNLGKLHKAIMSHPEMGPKVHISKGYVNMLMEFPWSQEDIATFEKTKGLNFTTGYPLKPGA
jgi:fatty acid desaturase